MNEMEKNQLRKVVYEAGGKLLLIIVVRYYFLLEFNEEFIQAERHLNENDSQELNSVENELKDLENIIRSIEKNGINKYSSAGELCLQKGKYLIRTSGLYKDKHQG